MSRVTTLPAPMMQRSPIFTPGQTTTPPPSQQSSPLISMAAPRSMGLPLGGIHRMNRGVEFAVGADERVGADGDASLVEEGAVRVDVDLLAEADAESVVAEEG